MEQTRGQTSVAGTITATVEDVDRIDRTVTFRDEGGDTFTVEAGDAARLERIQPNDKVNIAYRGVLDFALQEPGSAAKSGQTMSAKEVPRGVEYARVTNATVEILAVHPQGASVTFRDSLGEVQSVQVVNPANQPKVAKLQPGDQVNISMVEQLEVTLQE
jgi:hypothetical protein